MIFDTGLGEMVREVPSGLSREAADVRAAARAARQAAADLERRLEVSKSEYLDRLRIAFEEAGVYKAEISFDVTEGPSPSIFWTYELDVEGCVLRCARQDGMRYVHWDGGRGRPSWHWRPFGGPPLGGDRSACLWCQAGACKPALHGRNGALGDLVAAHAMKIDQESRGPFEAFTDRLKDEVIRHEQTASFHEARRSFATGVVRDAVRALSFAVAHADRDSVVEAVDLILAEGVLES